MKEMDIHTLAVVIAGAFTLWACILSIHLIYKHLRNYTKPHLQRCITRIILMVPIYAVDSWISLMWRKGSLYIDMLRDCYEAYVLFLFFTLLVNFLEGQEHESLVDILRRKPLMSHPPPTCFLPKVKPGHSFLIWCKFCVLQFAMIKPLTTIIRIILEQFDKYGDGSFAPNKGYLYLTIIDNISITISMYYLILFGKSVAEELKPFKPVAKFLCIKSIIFFSFWQGVAISVINYMGVIKQMHSWTPDQIADGAQNFLICFEMFIIAICHPYVFDYTPYRNPEKEPFLRSVFNGHARQNAVTLGSALMDTVNPAYDIETTRRTLRNTIIHTRSEMMPLLEALAREEDNEIELP